MNSTAAMRSFVDLQECVGPWKILERYRRLLVVSIAFAVPEAKVVSDELGWTESDHLQHCTPIGRSMQQDRSACSQKA